MDSSSEKWSRELHARVYRGEVRRVQSAGGKWWRKPGVERNGLCSAVA
jgi:hypothetical protein